MVALLGSGIRIFPTLACGGTPEPTATLDVDATVEAAIQATSLAELAMNATVSAAVDATATAAVAAATPIPTSPAGAAPTTQPAEAAPTTQPAEAAPTAQPAEPVPTDEYVTMTEEELAALIDQAVAEAMAASQEYATATMDATADDTVTQEEVTYVYNYYSSADAAIAYAEELLNAYYYYYGDLATETMAVLYEVEQDLGALAANTAALNNSLQEINATLEQGLAVAEETINQIETAAQTVQTNVAETQAQIEGMVENLHTEIENRAASVLSTRPTNIPTDLPSTIQAGFQYVDAVRGGLSDDKITRDELNKIAEMGANASAGFSKFGGPEHSRTPDAINGPDGVTANLARGRNTQAKEGLGNVEKSLGDRPSPGGISPGGGGVSPGGGGGGVSPGGGGGVSPGGGGGRSGGGGGSR